MTRMDGRIRKATDADRPAWFALRRLLWPDLDEAEEQAVSEAYFGGRVPNVDAVFVAVDDRDEVIGFAEYSVRSYVPGATAVRGPFLEGWYVAEHARGNGIGRALVAAGERWAIEQGFTQLGSDADPDNVGSIAAHQAIGFREVERVVSFIKDLDADG